MKTSIPKQRKLMASFSIVTVVYNDILHIKETMNSVIQQSCKDIEYILIDGESTDGTKDIISTTIASCANFTLKSTKKGYYYLEATHKDYPTFTFKFLSEKDNGIYDAMNKGIDLATNEWINFMNCGDRFYNSNVLKKIACKKMSKYDLIYGDTEIILGDCRTSFIRASYSSPNKLYKLFFGFCHQSTFIKTSLQKSLPYDTNYHLAADYDFFYKCFMEQKKILHIPQVVASFSTGGSSDKNAWKSLKEAIQVALKHNPSLFGKTKVIFYSFFAIFKKTIKLYCSPLFIKYILNFHPRKTT